MEESTVKKVPLVKRSTSYKIIIPALVERQIRYLCERVWSTEWSGVLFYTPSGSFEDGSLEIRCVDILPMDIGNATYTEFNMSPDVISYMAQKPELLDCKMGLIHSHNNMSTFFSGTDTATLNEEGNERNHFVSLIVNNAGKYTAAITRKVKFKSVRDLSYESFTGTIDLTEKEVVEGEEIEYFNLDIVFEEEQEDYITEISNRLDEIRKHKTPATSYGNYGGYPTSPTYKPDWSAPTGKVNTPTNIYKNPTLFDDVDWETPTIPKAHSAGNPVTEEPKEKKEKEVKEYTPGEEIFTPADIEKVMVQLITGSVTITSVDKDTKKKLVNTMDTRFDNRFGKNDPGLTLFEYWAVDFIEFLLWYSAGDRDVDECLAAEEMAIKVIAALEKLPTNKYVEKYIELFTRYADKF